MLDICKRLNESLFGIQYIPGNEEFKECSVLIENALNSFDLKVSDPEQALTFYVSGRAALLNNEQTQRVN